MPNPRSHLPPEKLCSHIFPPKHPKAGENCSAVKMRGSDMCYFHQEDKEKVIRQLNKARESKKEKETNPAMTHGYYSKTGLECAQCALGDGCQYYAEDKKVCDYNIVPRIDLGALSDIQNFAEEITKSEYKRYQKLEPYFLMSGELNIELHEASSRIASRLLKVLRDYATIKQIYEKNQGPVSWKDILRDAA